MGVETHWEKIQNPIVPETTLSHFERLQEMNASLSLDPFGIEGTSRSSMSVLVRSDETMKTLREKMSEGRRGGRGDIALSHSFGRRLEEEQLGLRSREAFPREDARDEVSSLYQRRPYGALIK